MSIPIYIYDHVAIGREMPRGKLLYTQQQWACAYLIHHIIIFTESRSFENKIVDQLGVLSFELMIP